MYFFLYDFYSKTKVKYDDVCENDSYLSSVHPWQHCKVKLILYCKTIIIFFIHTENVESHPSIPYKHLSSIKGNWRGMSLHWLFYYGFNGPANKSPTPAKRYTCAFTSLSAWTLANPSDECNTVFDNMTNFKILGRWLVL